MKKHLFSLAVGFMALTACTSEEITDINPAQSNAIGFENVVNKNSRAEVEGDLTKNTFDMFMVYGYYLKENSETPIQIFNGVPVKKVNDTWTYDGVRYWIPGCKYYFYGYSCADISLASGKGSPTLTLTNETTPEGRALSIMNFLCDHRHQHDLVYAENGPITALEKNNPAVSLPFKHALCKIKAVFTTDFSSDYTVKVSDVKLDEFYNIGSFNTRKKAWDSFTEEKDAYINLAIDPAKNTMTSKSGSKVETSEIFVIPTTYPTNEWVKLHFTIEVSKGNEVVMERNIYGSWSPNWEVGKIYTYNINITGSSAGIEPIVFAASQSLDDNSSWDTSTSVSMTFGVDTAGK